MRRLAAVGITTREACGNTVRNVTACPLAGVCRDRGVRRHALRQRDHVLPARPRRHAGLRPQVQDRLLGLQGQAVRPDQLPRHRRHRAHARRRRQDEARLRALRRRRPRRRAAERAAVRRVPARGRAAADRPRPSAACSRASARRRTAPRRASSSWSRSWASRSSSAWCWRSAPTLRPDPRWTAFLADLHATDEKPLRPAGALPPGPHPPGFDAWRASNVIPQRQPGYVDGDASPCRSAT